MKREKWFSKWFNSPYYHMLYRNRDHEEARFFLDNLIALLNPALDATFLDVGCGTGRHAVYLNKKGFDVTGMDLSTRNIAVAEKYANERLHFIRHDMRLPFKTSAFDYVLNLFTSFGYFDTEKEHRTTIEMMSKNLKPKGILVLDFLNPYAVINNLVKGEIKVIDTVTFHINRYYDGESIVKQIRFSDKGENYCFHEKVKAIRRVEFLEYYDAARLKVKKLLGGYDMQDYDKENSERLIFIAEK